MKSRTNGNGIQYLFALFIITCLVLTLLAPGCNQAPPQTESPPAQAPAEKDEAPLQPVTPPSAPSPPLELNLKLSHAPKVGERAGVTLVVTNNYLPTDKLGYIRAWLEFTYINTAGSYRESKEQVNVDYKNVLTRGDLNWEGTLTSDKPLEFHTDIRFPEAGIWEVTGYIEGNVGRIRSNRINLAVEQDRAGIYGSEAYAAGQLEWMKDYSPLRTHIPESPNTKRPVVAKLDLAKPPKLNEPVELSWSVVSIFDLENTQVWTEFKLLKQGSAEFEKIESREQLIDGDLQWEGPLKKDAPVSSSAIVKFPNEGDWEITLLFRDSKASHSTGYSVFLNVTEERGRWGWAEPHERDWSSVPPPPSVTDEELGR